MSIHLFCNRQLRNLPGLRDKARAISARLLETEAVGQDTVFVSPAFDMNLASCDLARLARNSMIGPVPGLASPPLPEPAAGSTRRHCRSQSCPPDPITGN